MQNRNSIVSFRQYNSFAISCKNELVTSTVPSSHLLGVIVFSIKLYMTHQQVMAAESFEVNRDKKLVVGFNSDGIEVGGLIVCLTLKVKFEK